jgi:hypothetical protein
LARVSASGVVVWRGSRLRHGGANRFAFGGGDASESSSFGRRRWRPSVMPLLKATSSISCASFPSCVSLSRGASSAWCFGFGGLCESFLFLSFFFFFLVVLLRKKIRKKRE